jgi:hypothetical protein
LIEGVTGQSLAAVRHQSGAIYITIVVVICLITTLILLAAYEGSVVGLLRHGAQKPVADGLVHRPAISKR